ncbi:MAG TPA: type II toxin-antitoxin system RelE/ParE family toxin [Candidatus Saccharimonadales bacterium]|nr:type II toxin-antitoxin system RelE/ParE family toxin [Candidatus Saccharimonadales bacterium]
MYKILYKKSVEKDLRKLPKSVLKPIVKKIQALSKNPKPNGSAKLHGATNLYRIRHTDYRIIYSLDGDELVIFVIKIAHRKEVYRDF